MNNVTILIVEDELILAKSVAKKLQNAGYEINAIVTSGEAAIESVQNNCPSLILMDIAIKGQMDGIETASKIKGISNVPVIFLTAYADDSIVDRASKVGGYGYLIKPFRDQELQATIKIALNKHQESLAIEQALQSTVNKYSLQYNDIYKDELTNLPNQLFLRDIFEHFTSFLDTEDSAASNSQSLQQSSVESSLDSSRLKLVAVLNISLDRLSQVSNFLTQEQQDELIQEVALRLSHCVGNFDAEGALVYLERDNYVVVAALNNKQQAQSCGRSILQEMTQAIDIDEQEVFLATSIGIAYSPSDSQDVEVLLEQSAKAREYARKQGSNRPQEFTFAFNIQSSRPSSSLTMESYLYHALEKEELELYYQPKINLKNNLITGAEALIRWNHPSLGRISADRFIPLAEESGLIRPIGEWVLNSACKQAKAWQDIGLNFIKIGINISGFQFRQSDLFHQITQTLSRTSLEPQFLELELTETILVENIKTNIRKLNLLKKIGVQIALDDFGTGYSSLGYLQKFPFDVLKIDSCFIRNIDTNKVNAIITQNIIKMAHQLNLKVAAEGVETKAELEFLKQCQCDEIQGYVYSRPLPVNEFRNLVFSQMNNHADLAINY